jgi:N-acetylmuramoyl-L-alanine amidase
MRSCDNLRWFALFAVAAVLFVAATTHVRAQSHAEELYKEALAREAQLRRELDSQPLHGETTLLERMRTLVTAYEDLSKLFPSSGYSDNALWQAAMLSADSFWQFGDSNDRSTALRLFTALTSRFPASSLLKRVPEQTARLEKVRNSVVDTQKPDTTATTPRVTVDPARRAVASASTLKSIRREVLPEVLRVTLELEREAPFATDRLASPSRVFVDLEQTRVIDALKDATIDFDDDVVRRIRVGRQLNVRTRVVLDLQNVGHYSVYALYNPYRIVIDFERATAAPMPATGKDTKVLASAVRKPEPVRAPALLPSSLLRENWTMLPAAPRREAVTASSVSGMPSAGPDTTIPAGDNTSLAVVEAPAAPRRASANRTGGYSFSRQLGLGIARVVIDPGTADTIPARRGTASPKPTSCSTWRCASKNSCRSNPASRSSSRVATIRSCRSRNERDRESARGRSVPLDPRQRQPEPVARGIETYFLNFAPNPEAEAIAARENAGSSRTMRHLSDIGSGDRDEQQDRRVARPRHERAGDALSRTAQDEQGRAQSRRQAGAVHGPDRRNDAEHPHRDLVHHERSGSESVEGREIPSADGGSIADGNHAIPTITQTSSVGRAIHSLTPRRPGALFGPQGNRRLDRGRPSSGNERRNSR